MNRAEAETALDKGQLYIAAGKAGPNSYKLRRNGKTRLRPEWHIPVKWALRCTGRIDAHILAMDALEIKP